MTTLVHTAHASSSLQGLIGAIQTRASHIAAQISERLSRVVVQGDPMPTYVGDVALLGHPLTLRDREHDLLG